MKNLKTKQQFTKQTFMRFLRAPAAALLFVVLAVGNAWSMEPATVAEMTGVVVYKTPSCGCCDKWVEHLQENDFSVEVNVVPETHSVRTQFGVPQEMASCHTAIVGGYWVEGHVPADLIQKLLAEKTEGIKGIAAPGMPMGSDHQVHSCRPRPLSW